jgi:hypothetical protein
MPSTTIHLTDPDRVLVAEYQFHLGIVGHHEPDFEVLCVTDEAGRVVELPGEDWEEVVEACWDEAMRGPQAA